MTLTGNLSFTPKLVGLVRKHWHLFSVSLALIPFASVVVTVLQEGVNVPFLDQWDKGTQIALQTRAGSLTFAQLVLPHGDHRILFTNLVTAVSARFFQWNLFLELFVTIVLAVGMLLVVVRLVKHGFPQIVFLVLPPVSFFIFSLRGRHTWMTSFQSYFLFVTLFFLLALWTLQVGKVGWRPVLAAAFFAICSTFSLANGLVAWPLLFVGLLLLGYRKPAYLIFWLLAATVSILLYYSPPYPVALSRPSLADLPAAVNYALIYLGSLLRPEVEDSISLRSLTVIVIASIALFLTNLGYLWWGKRSAKPIVPWLLLAGYSGGTAVLTGIGRVSLFASAPFQPLSERYVIIAAFWWVSFVVIGVAVVHAISQRSAASLPHQLLRLANLLCFGIVIVLMFHALYFHNRFIRIVSPESETCYANYIITHDPDLDCLRTSRMDLPDYWLPRLDQIAFNRLAMFSTVPLNVSLTTLAFDALQSAVPEPGYQTYTDSGRGNTVPALFEHAPALVEYKLHLPIYYPHTEFTALLYLDPSNVAKDPGTVQDGVIFSASIIDEAGEIHRSDDVRYDPHVNTEPIPFRLDLSPYLGQKIRLRLQTESLESVAYDWALWIDPTIRLSDATHES